MKYTVESLRQFGIQVAEKAGMSHQDAETLLKNLLFSDMRGVRSHGMTRLSGYVTRIERGSPPPPPTHHHHGQWCRVLYGRKQRHGLHHRHCRHAGVHPARPRNTVSAFAP